jgi:hypothetical protein
VNTEPEERFAAIRHEDGPQALPGLSMLQHAEWATAAATSPHGNDFPPMLIVDTANNISELLLLRRDRATNSSITLDFKNKFEWKP